ncbi:MAG: dihydroorotate dehydrogenase [Clostridiales bacterium]|jgi:dihydroorotate dehydrogenase (NAD+) catalytic subunit|nr:dihydroorotate dehydrogenase [Clostridiales bacterium]
MIDMSVEIAGVRFKNPVLTASGTFASGREYSEFFDLSRLGGVVVKGVSARPWEGNPPPRVAEVYGGMLNSVGLQNGGAERFLRDDLPFLRKFDTRVVVNICGHTIEEYAEVTKQLQNSDIDMLELNISCPNVSEGGMAFGTDPSMTARVVEAVAKAADKPLIVKLSPNVTDITEIARAAAGAGASALSLINTLLGMAIDAKTRRPVLANGYGGLSGPAVKPVALRMVHQTARAIDLPIIGMGGIMTGLDAAEFLLAGARAVAVGTAGFNNPTAAADVISGLENYMEESGFKTIPEIKMIYN